MSNSPNTAAAHWGPEFASKINKCQAKSCRILPVISYTTSMGIIPGSLVPQFLCIMVLFSKWIGSAQSETPKSTVWTPLQCYQALSSASPTWVTSKTLNANLIPKLIANLLHSIYSTVILSISLLRSLGLGVFSTTLKLPVLVEINYCHSSSSQQPCNCC